MKRPQPVRAVRPQARPAAAASTLDPEASAPGSVATIWLNRDLGDPTPASLRLAPGLALRLSATARATGADWALVLGVLRADESSATIAETAAALARTGETAASDRAIALARYYRAVGLPSLVHGLLSQREALAKRLLADERVDLYAGGRADLEAGRVDVRVLAVIAYLAEAYGQVTVSSLFTGHRLYSRPGVVSAHIFGHAVDIAMVGGIPVAGNQAPGGLTERAVRDILLLPGEVRPRQVISLLGLGGPSFPLADHTDHIHVGY